MLEVILADLGKAISVALNFNDLPMLLAVLVISVFAGLKMGSFGNVFGAMLSSVLLLAIFNYLWNWLSSAGRFSYDVGQAETLRAWDGLMGLPGFAVIGYLAVFFVLVSAVFVIKSFANR